MWCCTVDQWRVSKGLKEDVGSSLVDRRVVSKEPDRTVSMVVLFRHSKAKAASMLIGHHRVSNGRCRPNSGEEGLDQAMIFSRDSMGIKVLEELRHNLMVLVVSYLLLRQMPAQPFGNSNAQQGFARGQPHKNGVGGFRLPNALGAGNFQ